MGGKIGNKNGPTTISIRAYEIKLRQTNCKVTKQTLGVGLKTKES